MSHSKRNTSLAFFTSHERSLLTSTWGSQRTRLTRDSFLPFGSCQLCLLPTRSPVACSRGHLFCRECVVTNLLAQGRELKRLRKEKERRGKEDEDEKVLEDEGKRVREVEEFERAQVGGGGENGRFGLKDHGEGRYKGVKRKLDPDHDDFTNGADSHKSKRRPSTTPNGNSTPMEESSFWIPSKIPSNHTANPTTIREHPICPAGALDKPHDFSLKTLITVNFTEEEEESKPAAAADDSGGGGEGPTRTCPSCNKRLSNATKAMLARGCGHVVCRPCSDKFQTSFLQEDDAGLEGKGEGTARCYLCSADVTAGRKPKRDGEKAREDGKRGKDEAAEGGLVELSSEGTGFAGGGKNMVKKDGVAFQC